MRHLLLVPIFAAALGLFPVVSTADEPPYFQDIAEATGLDFVHWNGMTGELYFVEMTGQGGAFLDVDGDGDLDVYLAQGAPLGDGEPLVPRDPKAGPPRDRLFRNDLVRGPDGRPTPRFVDVTATSGIEATGYGMGVATGDIDRDGDVDLYVTNYGENQLWRNEGDGTFRDVTAASGTGDDGWSTSAAFADIDGDGHLDLYVVNYVEYQVEHNVLCYAASSRRDYCGPQAFPPTPDRLFRNRGDGTFEDVTLKLLADYTPGPGLGVVAADLDGDRRPDLYIANDGAANQLWLGPVDDRSALYDDALLTGTAVNRSGQPEASMGVDAGDVDGDGDFDLVLAHLTGETNTIYINDGAALFTDRSVESGLAAPSFDMTAFGAGFLDADNDGWLDLLTLNGAVKVVEALAREGDPFPLDQPNQFFKNTGDGRYVEATAAAGPVFALAEVSRGAAFGDVDGDGDADVLLTNNNGRARLLENLVGSQNAFLGVRPTRFMSDVLGTVVEVTFADEAASPRRRLGRARTDGSYLSAHDPRVLLGLGIADETARPILQIRWPDGRLERWHGLPTDRYLERRRGD